MTKNEVLDVMARIPVDEPIYVLRAADPTTPEVLRARVSRLAQINGTLESRQQAADNEQECRDWQRMRPGRILARGF